MRACFWCLRFSPRSRKGVGDQAAGKEQEKVEGELAGQSSVLAAETAKLGKLGDAVEVFGKVARTAIPEQKDAGKTATHGLLAFGS